MPIVHLFYMGYAWYFAQTQHTCDLAQPVPYTLAALCPLPTADLCHLPRDLYCLSAPLIGFKNLPSGDVGTNAWSVKGKQVSTGTYTFYREEEALIVGTQVAAPQTAGSAPQNLQACLDACDDDKECAGESL